MNKLFENDQSSQSKVARRSNREYCLKAMYISRPHGGKQTAATSYRFLRGKPGNRYAVDKRYCVITIGIPIPRNNMVNW